MDGHSENKNENSIHPSPPAPSPPPLTQTHFAEQQSLTKGMYIDASKLCTK